MSRRMKTGKNLPEENLEKGILFRSEWEFSTIQKQNHEVHVKCLKLKPKRHTPPWEGKHIPD